MVNQGSPTVIYDLTLPQPERKEKAQHFTSSAKAARWLGMKNNKIAYYTKPEEQKKYFSEKHNKHFAIRWDKSGIK